MPEEAVNQSDVGDIVARIETLDWALVAASLNQRGWALLPALLTQAACERTTALYEESGRFRSRVIMARHGYGSGEYQYFAYPLPDLVGGLRRALYPHLAPIADRWQEALGNATRFPLSHAGFIDHCHAAGQMRPTPLLLRYGTGDYNCLHQDLYGAQVFPLQVAILLSQPGEAFTGGEFVMTEQRPRMQSRPSVVPLRQGDGVVFAVNHRPVRGSRGFYRTVLRHGVSAVHTGRRHTLGIIFHDAA